jgi:hypothetical protein
MSKDIESLASPEQQDIISLLDTCGMSDLLTTKLSRRIGRDNNLEVWQ